MMEMLRGDDAIGIATDRSAGIGVSIVSGEIAARYEKTYAVPLLEHVRDRVELHVKAVHRSRFHKHLPSERLAKASAHEGFGDSN